MILFMSARNLDSKRGTRASQTPVLFLPLLSLCPVLSSLHQFSPPLPMRLLKPVSQSNFEAHGPVKAVMVVGENILQINGCYT